MAWSRRWRIADREKWSAVLRALLGFEIDFARNPVEIIAREELREKSDGQRALFHAIVSDLATEIGYTPGQLKCEIKRIYFGDDWAHYSTEDLDHARYGELIETAYMVAADLGIFIPDRRRR